jgi:hypothetical protein
MTTARGATATVRIVDGTWWDRLRRVDHRIWDAVLALALLVPGVLAFASRLHRPDEAPEQIGFGLIVVAAGPKVTHPKLATGRPRAGLNSWFSWIPPPAP